MWATCGVLMAQAFTLELRAGADAFGDGSHPSTQGAIVALEALSHLQGLSCALDVGCGSGLLALQMAYQWHIPVVATDINAHAVAATQANA
jgi:ribosomal protein L11 methyltransferase